MPKAKLRIRPEAEADVERSYIWYEQQFSGLGEAFFDELDRLYARILDHSQLYQRVHREFRRAATRRFPIAVFYLIAEEYVEVVAVLPQMQDPERWRSRLTG